MSGGPDPLYVRARSALLDAAEALAEQLDAVVLVGAQAVYLHTGDADFATAEYTTDADFCVAPPDLSDKPLLAELLGARGFSLGEHPGVWISPNGISVDLMVPEVLAGVGSRGARLGPHGKKAARRAKGLEGALVDRERMEIASLDPGDERSIEMLVAGPAALLVAKVHKIADRAEIGSRVSDKDALDLLRLLRAIDTATLAAGLLRLADQELGAAVTADAMSRLGALFGRPEAVGISMAIRAAGPDAVADVVSASFTALVSDLLTATAARRMPAEPRILGAAT
ncbi:MAG: hypothetical protein F4018_09920 [Acidobacteria bacterium]|nr:hypothetical protein [Acidobacteriota bacterium]MYK88617.1 hypothetical protein [Acidobacteriota bacterium]